MSFNSTKLTNFLCYSSMINNKVLNAVFYPIADSWITIGLVLLLTQCSMSPIRETFAINSSRVAEKLHRTARVEGDWTDQRLRLSRGAKARRCTWKDRGANFCRVIKEALFVQGARPSTTYSNTSNADRYHWRQSFYGRYYTEPGRISLLNVCSRSFPIMILENRIRLIEIQLRCQTPLNPPGNKSEGGEGKDEFRRDFIRGVTTTAAKLRDGN